MNDIDASFSKAQKYLRSAAVLLELEDFDSCVSRAYYAMFYAANGVLTAEGEKSPGRQNLRSTFQKRFVDSGRLPDQAGEAFQKASDLRERADYSLGDIPQVDAERCLQHAEAFVNSLEQTVEKMA